MRFSKYVSVARYAALIIPLFGLASAVQLGCEAKRAEDVGSEDGNIRQGYGGGYGSGYDDDAYDGYSYGYGYDDNGY